VDEIGIPSTTYKGELFPVNDRAPLTTNCEEAPGIPLEGLISIPATLPCMAERRFAFPVFTSSSLATP